MRARVSFLLALVLLTGACGAGRRAFNRGNNEAKRGNWDGAAVHYTRATREAPDNIQYRIMLERALVEVSTIHVKKAREHVAAKELDKAVSELEIAVEVDPSNRLAQDLLKTTREEQKKQEEMKRQIVAFDARRARARQLFSTEPQLDRTSQVPINLKFATDTSLQKIFEALSQLSGINILFDEAFRDKRVTIDLVDVSFREALDKLMLINHLFYKVVDPATLIIIPDSAQKRRQYDDLMLKTFYIKTAEVNTIANMLRTIVGIQRVQPNAELRAITVRATADQIAVAERIVEANDKRKSEVLLDIEILEVNVQKMLDFGLRLAEYNVSLGYAPAGGTVGSTGTNVTQRLNRLAAGDISDFVLTLPNSASYRLFKSTSNARALASPKIRALEGKRAEIRIGNEVPIPVTSFVSQFGTPGGIPTSPVTSFQYRTVGLNVGVTPKVSIDGVVELEVSLETSALGPTTTIGGIALPNFISRNVTNVVSLKDGETNLIGGLIQRFYSTNKSGIPGLMDVPLLNKFLFGETTTVNEIDIVFTITPHLVSAPLVTDEDLAAFPMGTDQQVSVPGLRSPIFDPEPQAPQGGAPGSPEAGALEQSQSRPTQEPPALPPATAPQPTTSAPPATPPATPLPGGTPEAPVAVPVSVLFSPPTATVEAGDEVELAMVVGGATNLSSGEITILFDANGMEVSEVQPGAFLSIDGKQVSFTPVTEPGRIRIQFARAGDTSGLRGSGQIARVVFGTLAPGPPRVVSASGTLRDPAGAPLAASFASARIVVQ